MIPPPDRTCPQCGNTIPYEAKICHVCGHGRRANSTAIAIWVLLLVLVGMPAGLLGGCFLLMSGGMGGGAAGTAQMLGLGLIGVALPVFFLVMLIRAGRK